MASLSVDPTSLNKDSLLLRRQLFLFYAISLVLFLSACGNTTTSLTSNPPIDTPRANQQTLTISSIATKGIFQEYALPQINSGIMRPAIDHKGRIWFGEMGHNYLAVFDPRRHKFQQMIPPRGAAGIMGITVASDDTIWFAEQYANYIGHYFPDTGLYQTYNLPTLTVPDPSNQQKTLTLPTAPNDVALDTRGNLWFTEMNADELGMLNTQTGHFKHYLLTSKKSVQVLNPYGITVDAQGRVWFTEASTNHIGRLDPNTGDIHLFVMSDLTDTLMEIAHDPHGIIWATSFHAGLLLRLDPSTGAFTRYASNSAGGLYGLTITPNAEIWVTVPAENVIARLDTAADHFVYYHIPTEASLPLGIVADTHHSLWFTEAASDKIGLLKPDE